MLGWCRCGVAARSTQRRRNPSEGSPPDQCRATEFSLSRCATPVPSSLGHSPTPVDGATPSEGSEGTARIHRSPRARCHLQKVRLQTNQRVTNLQPGAGRAACDFPHASAQVEAAPFSVRLHVEGPAPRNQPGTGSEAAWCPLKVQVSMCWWRGAEAGSRCARSGVGATKSMPGSLRPAGIFTAGLGSLSAVLRALSHPVRRP